jgi:hypothetical protein
MSPSSQEHGFTTGLHGFDCSFCHALVFAAAILTDNNHNYEQP